MPIIWLLRKPEFRSRRLKPPLDAVDAEVVTFLVRSNQNANLDRIVFISPQQRRERIAGLHVGRQRRIEVWLHVEVERLRE